MNIGDWLQGMAEKMPGNKWASSTSLGSAATGGLPAALTRNHWSFPTGHDTSSFDDLAGAGSTGSRTFRNAARGTGAAFAGGGLYKLLAGLGAGASQVGEGFPLAEEAGGSA